MFSEERIKELLHQVETGKVSVEKAFQTLQHLPYENLEVARIDHHRSIRTDMPEVVFAPGKSVAHLVKIIPSLKKAKQSILITRLEKPIFKVLKKKFPFLSYSDESKIAFYKEHQKRSPHAKRHANESKNFIAVVTAGTSDIPIAEEASVTLEVMDAQVERFFDCGVAGLHRLLDVLPRLRRATAIICVAGMEGALASVLAGLVNKPVIAVPTSVGYGASFGGVAPLLTMLNSCATGVAVMNIDNGFGAACFAYMISKKGE
jgi:NCAIR mutase (PurE)-related protein